MDVQKIPMTKRHFRIGDLAQELGVKKFVIRFWEKEFKLKSDRSMGGQRSYTQEDFIMFATIKELLYKKGFTISGAKKQLAQGITLEDAQHGVFFEGAAEQVQQRPGPSETQNPNPPTESQNIMPARTQEPFYQTLTLFKEQLIIFRDRLN